MSIRSLLGICAVVLAFIKVGLAVVSLIPEERGDEDRIGYAVAPVEDDAPAIAKGATVLAGLGVLFSVGRSLRH